MRNAMRCVDIHSWKVQATSRFEDGENTDEKREPLSKRWPTWAKVFSIIGICLILFFFVPLPVLQGHNMQTLIDNEQWQFPPSVPGIFWNISLQFGDKLLVDLKVFSDLEVIFYIRDELDNRWLKSTTSGFVQNWTTPLTGNYSINIDNQYIQELPKGTILVRRYLGKPEYKTEYPYRSLQFALLAVGVIQLATGFSAHPRFVHKKNTREDPYEMNLLPHSYELHVRFHRC